MELFELVNQKISKAGKEVQIWKNTTQMNNLLEEEKSKQQQLFIQLGKQYYNEIKMNVPEKYYEIVEQINESIMREKNLVEQIHKIKQVKICSYCGTQVIGDALFCQQCGKEVNVENSIKYCICGTKINEGDFFCAGCGRKIED